MPSKVWDEITDPFPNFNGTIVEVWEWVSNFIPHIIMEVITCLVKSGMKLLIHSKTSNGVTIELWEWVSKFSPYFIMDVITYPCWD